MENNHEQPASIQVLSIHKRNLIFTLSKCKDKKEITHQLSHSQIFGNQSLEDLIMEVKQDGKHGLTLQAWTNKKLWWTSNTWLWESVLTKVPIAQIQSMKNGKSNSINAITMKLRLTQITLKMIFVKVMLIATMIFVVVLPQLMMKMASKWEKCMSVTIRPLLSGLTIWTTKHSTHSNACPLKMLQFKLVPHLLPQPPCSI